MRWPHGIRIEVAPVAGGAQNASTGRWEPAVAPAGDPVVLYDGLGDMQRKPRTVRRSSDRDTQLLSEADVFLADETDLTTIPEGARVVVSEDGVEVLHGHVVTVGHLDGVIYVAQLAEVA